ncbi:hypothetical protein ACF0H5_009842 [Mactra antiquata]
MMSFLCVVLLSTLTTWTIVHGMDETVLATIPVPMKKFDLSQSLGRWYYQFQKAPCSWSGSSEFSDYEIFLSAENSKSILFTLTMRIDICNQITGRAFINPQPGVFRSKDSIGNVFSGLYVIVAEDPKTYSIVYGCTKLSAFGNKCEDASITVKTRVPFPNKKIIAQIYNVLMAVWGISIHDLQRVPFRESCVKQQRTKYTYG